MIDEKMRELHGINPDQSEPDRAACGETFDPAWLPGCVDDGLVRKCQAEW